MSLTSSYNEMYSSVCVTGEAGVVSGLRDGGALSEVQY